MSTRLTEAELARLEGLRAAAVAAKRDVASAGSDAQSDEWYEQVGEAIVAFEDAVELHMPALIAAARRAAVLERALLNAVDYQKALEYHETGRESPIPGHTPKWYVEALAALDAAGKEVQGC